MVFVPGHGQIFVPIPYVLTIASGGSFEFMKDKDSTIASCTDLFRPVIFKIERVM